MLQSLTEKRNDCNLNDDSGVLAGTKCVTMRYSGEFAVSRRDRNIILLNAVLPFCSHKIRGDSSVRAADLLKILIRIKLNIRIDS